MGKYLLERLLLPAFENLVVEELLREVILSRNIDDQFRIDHYSPQDQNSRVVFSEGRVRGQEQSLIPMLVCELEIVSNLILFN